MTLSANMAVGQGALDAARRANEGLYAIFLLAGGASLGALSAATHRCVLDLPVSGPSSLLSHWMDQFQQAARRHRSLHAPVRIVGGAAPHLRSGSDPISVDHISDPQELRGTGGVLRDVAAHLPEDGYVLVASAAMILTAPLDELVAELLDTRAQVAFHVCDSGSSSSVMLIRCGCLRSIASVGYIDFKEQALPTIAAASSVAVIRRREPIALSVRSTADYIRALRAHHEKLAESAANGNAYAGGAFSERWRPAFRIVEAGANVDPAARLHDSVVLSGATVGRNAVVVRSLICPGAMVPPGATVMDECVTPRGAARAGRARGKA